MPAPPACLPACPDIGGLDALHWDEASQAYADWGNHTEAVRLQRQRRRLPDGSVEVGERTGWLDLPWMLQGCVCGGVACGQQPGALATLDMHGFPPLPLAFLVCSIAALPCKIPREWLDGQGWLPP
jgi:hypothetical protein